MSLLVLLVIVLTTATFITAGHGHAVVTIDVGKVKADQLVGAVNGVKGDVWHCTGRAMK